MLTVDTNHASHHAHHKDHPMMSLGVAGFVINIFIASEMYYSRSVAFIGLALAAPTAAFVSTTRGASSRSHEGATLRASRDPNDDRATPDIVRNLAAVSVLSLGMLFPSTDAFAAQGSADHALQSSSMGLSTEIKTMDFSMPSSYDSIATPTVMGSDVLTKEAVKKPEPKPKKEAAPKREKKEKKEASEGGGFGIDMGSINPFAGGDKDGPSAKEQAAAKVAAKKAQREADEAAQKERDREAALKLQEDIKAAREAKIQARAEAIAEEKAISQAKS